MSLVEIQMDFSIPHRLIEIYRKSTEETILGYDEPLSWEEAEAKLSQYASTRMYGKFERTSILKIWYGDVLVGYSFPRAIEQREYRGLKIDEDDTRQWNRLGSIYIHPQYRGRGIIQEVIRQFGVKYPNLIWQCKSHNEASFKSAQKAGFVYSHSLYFLTDSTWSFEKDETQTVFEYKYLKRCV